MLPAISSAALGQARAGHALEHRLDMAVRYGFTSVVLSFDDIAFMAQLLPPGKTTSTSATSSSSSSSGTTTITHSSMADYAVDGPLRRAAAVVHDLCSHRHLAVAALQPFRHLEGLRHRPALAVRLGQLAAWAAAARVLETNLVVVWANELPAMRVAGDEETVVHDLRAAADAVAPLRLAYTATPAATHVTTWPQAWALVQRAARPNLGLGLDAAAVDVADLDRLAEVDADRVFFVQAADLVPKAKVPKAAKAAKAPNAAKTAHPSNEKAYDSDSSEEDECADSRLFYGETGGDTAAQAIRALGYEGWVGLDVAVQRTTDTDAVVPKEMARRGAAAWARLASDVRFGRSKKRPALFGWLCGGYR